MFLSPRYAGLAEKKNRRWAVGVEVVSTTLGDGPSIMPNVMTAACRKQLRRIEYAVSLQIAAKSASERQVA